MVPNGGGGVDLDGALAPAIPTRHRDALPLRSRVDQRRGEARQALALGPGPPARPGLAGRGWFVEGSIERRRVIEVTPWRASAARSSRAAKALSPISTNSRPGSPRRARQPTRRPPRAGG